MRTRQPTDLRPKQRGDRITGAASCSPLAVAAITALPLLLAVGIVAGAHRSTASLTPARSSEVVWPRREAALRQSLARDPGDERARVLLSGVLIEQAKAEAQQAHPTERAASEADAATLEARTAEAVRFSPRLAEARRLVDVVATQGRDRRQRARAWAWLARIHWLLDNPDEGMACMEAAAREDASYRFDLAVLKDAQ